MKLDLFDDMEGVFLREREGSLLAADQMRSGNTSSPDTASMPERPRLAMAYVPWQQWGETMDSDSALECGTMFKDLVFPFERGGGKQ